MARKSSLDGRANRAPSAPYTGPVPARSAGWTYRDGRFLASGVTGVGAHRVRYWILLRDACEVTCDERRLLLPPDVETTCQSHVLYLVSKFHRAKGELHERFPIPPLPRHRYPGAFG